MGHLYYVEKIPREWKDGRKEDQRFRLEFREEPLEPKKRSPIPVHVKTEIMKRVTSEAGLEMERILQVLQDKKEVPE